MQEILNFISNFIPITGDSLIDSLIFIVITTASFVVAWTLTGFISNLLGFFDRNGMSLFHWLIRVVVFFCLTTTAIAVFKFLFWICNLPWWGYLVLAFVFCAIVSLVIVLNKTRKKEENNE